MRWTVLLAALALPALAFSQVTASPTTLVCSGSLTQAQGMIWAQRTVEFSLDYSPKMQTTLLKSNVEPLNAPLLVEMDEAFLKAKESQTRPLGTNDRSLGITDLKISRKTGQFSMAVSVYRDLDVLDGRSLWEGNCAPRGGQEKKF